MIEAALALARRTFVHLAVCPPLPLPPLNGAGPQTAAERAAAARARADRMRADLRWHVAAADVRSPTTARVSTEPADGACAMRVLVVAALVLDNAERERRGGVLECATFVPEASVAQGSALLLDEGEIDDGGFDGMENLSDLRKRKLHAGSLCRLLRSFCAVELNRSVAKPSVSRTVVHVAGGNGSRDADGARGGSSWPAWPAVAAALRIATCGDRNVLALHTVSSGRSHGGGARTSGRFAFNCLNCFENSAQPACSLPCRSVAGAARPPRPR